MILINGTEVKSITIHDNNEALAAVRDIPRVFVSDKYLEAYPTFVLVREGVAKRIATAAQSLPDKLAFMFYEGHRPLDVQKTYFSQYEEILKKQNPDWDEQKLMHETCKLVAPAVDNPPHSTGAAFDLTLCTEDGTDLDMGSPIDDDPSKNEGRNIMDCPLLDDQAKANRAILNNALSEQGFVAYDYEWWHWSYGDQYWAFKRGESAAIYASVDACGHALWQTPKPFNFVEAAA